MRINLTAAHRVNGPAGASRPASGARPATTSQRFDRLLRSALEGGSGVKLSAHAQQRLDARGISLDDTQLARLGEAVGRAEAKAGTRSLVLLDDLAFIVSVPTRTVITAMDEPREGVFTNIDSAVIG
jgi:flagellar operon protein